MNFLINIPYKLLIIVNCPIMHATINGYVYGDVGVPVSGYVDVTANRHVDV